MKAVSLVTLVTLENEAVTLITLVTLADLMRGVVIHVKVLACSSLGF